MNHEKQQPNNAMWYYLRDNQPIGPVDSAEITRLKGSGDVTRSTKVWRDGMAEWQPAISTELGGMFPKNAPPPVSPPAITVPIQRADDVKRLNTWFTVFWIAVVASVFSLVAGFISQQPIVIAIAICGPIPAVIFLCFILHRLWSLVPPAEAQTTPGKAIGFLFIPLFNFYWCFVAIHGLAKAINAQIRRASIPGKQVNEGLTLTFCILMCCSIVPFLGAIISIAGTIMLIFPLQQLKDAGIALIEKENA